MRKTPLTPGRFGIVLIKGAGDLGSGVAYRLWRCGFQVVMTELAQPLCVRRAVCFAEAVYAGETTVEGITARRVHTLAAARAALSDDVLPLLVTPDPGLLAELTPTVVVDAIMAKANSGTQITDAPLVIALGPGFTAAHDCHAIVETHRGHTLGRVLWKGQALPDTGTPGPIEGYTATRVLRAPIEGYVIPLRAVGEHIKAGEILARVSPQPASEQGIPVRALFPGVLRGLVHPSLLVQIGRKIGDLDPRDDVSYCFTISEKSLAVAGGVLEAILSSGSLTGPLSINGNTHL
ncbi:MAG: selenium-dependent molybdenum cofactor biosynthesis protein YqeB [Anaerolineae bacterium]|nr:EF2563 family selenium-dependent molybdenum hydroxylase system protein [Anaerolineae bacterium]